MQDLKWKDESKEKKLKGEQKMIGSDILIFLLSLAFIVGTGIRVVISYSLGKVEK